MDPFLLGAGGDDLAAFAAREPLLLHDAHLGEGRARDFGREDEGHWPVTEENVQELSTFEREVLSQRVAVIMLTTGNSYYQCQQGFLDEETCQAILSVIGPGTILTMKAVGRDMRQNRASFIKEIRRISREAGIAQIDEDGTWN